MRLSFLATPLIVAALAGSAVARDVVGSVAYRERIALPPGAELVVVLNGPGGQLAEMRTTPGGQVPLPFTVSTNDDGPLSLRAALFSGGIPLWMTAEIPVPQGPDVIDLGEIALYRHVSLGFAGTMLCGDRVVAVGFAGDAARLRVDGQVIELQPEIAGSGARYADGAGTIFWSRGNRATLTLDGADLPECLPVIAPTLPLVARGNEPGWVVTLAHEGLVYSGEDGSRRDLPLPAETQTEAGTLFDADEGLAVTVSERLCRDSMTGMPYPYSVGILLEGQTLDGCGGDPLALLAGAWRLIERPGPTLLDGAEMTLEIAGDLIAGNGGCNRYTGTLSLTGEHLTLQPGGVTMMACEERLMQLEDAYLDRLGQVSGFDIDASGRLVLLVQGTPWAVFAR